MSGEPFGSQDGSQDGREPLLCRLYQRYLDDENAASFVRDVSSSYLVGSLARLTQSDDARRRRAAVLAVSMLGDYQQNAALGRRLLDTDRAVRMLAESGIRELWRRQGTEGQRHRLADLIRRIQAGQYERSVVEATKLIEETPWFAECWNQRAVAYFQLKRYDDSANDCHQTLELNAYHFAAAVGMGHCYLEMNDPYAALDCFRRALRLNPSMEGVRAQVDYLRRALGVGNDD